MALKPGMRLGAYEIRGPLGAGGMGEVYRAWDPRLGREVAVKVLPESASADPDRRRRFEQEARAAGSLNHPNVLAVHDVGSHESVHYIVSELLEGGTLRDQIRSGGLTPRKAVEYAVQIARGLSAAHQRGLVHRDIKPENVFVTRDGLVKILDFGLAKLRLETAGDPGHESATLETRSGVVVGTLPYLSPEQVRGLPADARSDMFALGSVLYEMLAGRRPFTGETASEIVTAVLRSDAPDLTTVDGRVSPALAAVVRRCLEKRPEDRFESAHDLGFALEAVATATSPTADAAERRRGRLALTAAAGLLGGLVLCSLLLTLLRRPPGVPSYTRLTFRRGAVLSARFAHDGRTVVYSAAWDGHPAQVFATRVGSGESRPLGLEGLVLAVSSRDEVAVKRGRFLGVQTTGQPPLGTLTRVPLEGGAPRDVIKDVQVADWGPDGKDLAVVRRVEGRKRLEYPIGHVALEDDVFGVRVLPDGHLVTVRARQMGNLGAWRFDVLLLDRAGHEKVLSPGWNQFPNLSWSDGSREIVFAENGAHQTGLHAVSPDGRQRLLARLPGQYEQHDVAPDGRLLLVRQSWAGTLVGRAPGGSRERELSWLGAGALIDLSLDGRYALLTDYGWAGAGLESLYLRPTDGSPAVRLGSYRGLSLSPDGRFVLALPGGQEFSDRLLVIPTGAGERRELRHPSLLRISAAAWFPDGKRIVVVSDDDYRRSRLLAWDTEGGAAPRELSADLEGKRPEEMPVVSHDGQEVALAFTGTGPLLFPVDGGPTRAVPGGLPEDEPLQFTRDGRWLFVRRTPAFRPDTVRVTVDRIDLATGRRVPWKELAPADPAGFYSIGPIHVTPDGESYAYMLLAYTGELYLAEALR
jgi:hypothetical protein